MQYYIINSNFAACDFVSFFTKYIYSFLDSTFAKGSVNVRKGSYVIETRPHVGHSSLDLTCPCIKSTIMDLLRSRWLVQASAAASVSERPKPSTCSTIGFLRI